MPPPPQFPKIRKARNCASPCPQFAVEMYREPNPITNSTTETLITTIVALKLALSLIPMQRMNVITSAITNAGRLNPISAPKILGAAIRSCARCTNSGDVRRDDHHHAIEKRLRARH